jgi:hypothetical protein
MLRDLYLIFGLNTWPVFNKIPLNAEASPFLMPQVSLFGAYPEAP